MTGIVNSTGARSGIIGTTVGTPAGGQVVKTYQTHRAMTGSHVATQSASAAATGITLTCDAAGSGNYMYIQFGTSCQHGLVGSTDSIYIYANKNSGGMAEVVKFHNNAGSQPASATEYYNIDYADSASVESGTNVYEIYMSASNAGASNFYVAHSSRPYTFLIMEINP